MKNFKLFGVLLIALVFSISLTAQRLEDKPTSNLKDNSLIGMQDSTNAHLSDPTKGTHEWRKMPVWKFIQKLNQDLQFVGLSGDETIGGEKIFTENVISSEGFHHKDTELNFPLWATETSPSNYYPYSFSSTADNWIVFGDRKGGAIHQSDANGGAKFVKYIGNKGNLDYWAGSANWAWVDTTDLDEVVSHSRFLHHVGYEFVGQDGNKDYSFQNHATPDKFKNFEIFRIGKIYDKSNKLMSVWEDSTKIYNKLIVEQDLEVNGGIMSQKTISASKFKASKKMFTNGQYNGWFGIQQDASDGWAISGGFDMRDENKPYQLKSSGLRLGAHLINPIENDTINHAPLISAVVTSDSFNGENWLGNSVKITKTPLFGVGHYGHGYQMKVWFDSTKIFNTLIAEEGLEVKGTATIEDALVLKPRSTLPSDPEDGTMVVYDGTGVQELYIRMTGIWRKIE